MEKEFYLTSGNATISFDCELLSSFIPLLSKRVVLQLFYF